MDADETDFKLFGKSKNHDKKDGKDMGSMEQAPKKPERIISRPTIHREYETKNKKLGIALILNHKNIRGQSPRNGTEIDRKSIKIALNSFGFETRVYDDLSFEDINTLLDKVAKEDHSESDCFVTVVMSHGLPGKVYASDMAYPVERLWKPFLGDKCASLINKPKIFFIQACRGIETDSPVTYKQFATMTRFNENDNRPYAIPNTADLLVMYSTMDGHYSWRNPTMGSWFIQALSKVMTEYADQGLDAELFDLLTAVNRKVAYEYQSNVPLDESMDGMKEMPNFVSTLTKRFYLRIKLTENK